MVVDTGECVTARDVKFDESNFPFKEMKNKKDREVTFEEDWKTLLNGDDYQIDEKHEERKDDYSDDEKHSEEKSDNIEMEFEELDYQSPLRRSKRTTQPSLKNLEKYAANCVLHNEQVFMVGDDEPGTYKEAMKRQDSEKWKEAINAEITSLLKNNTWRHISKDEEKRVSNPISAKWVFKIKRKSDGSIDRYKARLVAKGFTQKFGVDFVETFAPVARIGSIRVLLSVACRRNYNINQWDVDTAFLNPTLKEDIYMYLPDGVNFEGSIIVKLLKGLYGLKQASREWYLMIRKIMIALGFKPADNEACIFIKQEGDFIIIVGIYVDDFIIVDNEPRLRMWLFGELQKNFKLKDLGELHWFLGLRITRNRLERTLVIDQEAYILDTLKLFHMLDCNPTPTPEVSGSKTNVKDDNTKSHNDNENPYRQAVGKLMYAMVCTRPDIASAVREVSKHLCDNNDDNWSDVQRIMRYLKGTSGLGIKFNGNANDNLVCYCDADYANDKSTRRSVTGSVCFLNGGPVSWSSKAQKTIAHSSCEAEYMALDAAGREVVYLRGLLFDLCALKKGPTLVYEDNQGAIDLTRNQEHHARNKHIDVRHHYIREIVENEVIKIEHMPTDKMVADIFTKALPRVKFEQHRDVLMNV